MKPHSVISKASVAFLIVLGISACSVDDRQLLAISTKPDVGGPNCGQIPDCDTQDDIDAGGAWKLDQSCTGLCPDLNHNDLIDTSETLVSNLSFNADIDGWNPDMGVGLGWNGMDACGRCDSGALAVTNQYAGTSGDIAVGGARQCLTIEPNQRLEVMARVNPEPESLGGIGLDFYASTDCSGDTIKGLSISSPLVVTDSQWQRASTPGTASDATHSVSIRLFVSASVKPKAGFANVFFDNILVTSK